jgi:hypothetical protein
MVMKSLNLSKEELYFILNLLKYDQMTDYDFYTTDQWELQKLLIDKFEGLYNCFQTEKLVLKI